MPIYEYRCGSCGTQQDVMQKISDAPLTICPKCGRETFSRQLTAASFQLKGSGWYATDFKGTGKRPDTGADTTTSPAPAASTASTSTTGDSA